MLIEWHALFHQMILDAYFLFIENIVHVEQIVLRHEINWENQNSLIQERLNLQKGSVLNTDIVKLNLVEVPLSVVKLVNILIYVPLWEMMLQEES